MKNKNIFLQKNDINCYLRNIRNKHNSLVLWFTGLSGSGKSTIANILEKNLYVYNIHTYLLDGDNIRSGLCKDLNFTKCDRKENLRRIIEVMNLLLDSGLVVLSTFISPYQKDRVLLKENIGCNRFFEIFVDTPLEVCKSRDPKGLYKKAMFGKIPNFTGITDIYEKPTKPDIYINGELNLYENVQNIMFFIKKKIFL